MPDQATASISITRANLTDWLLVATVFAGLFFPFALVALVLIILLRGPRIPRPHAPLVFLTASAIWAVFVMTVRGAPETNKQLMYFLFLWFLPWLLACYRPDTSTVQRFGHFLIALLIIDLSFNLFTLTTSRDLLGRELDVREGLLGGRGGGVFAHSFSSGSISLAALMTLVVRAQLKWLALLPIINLLLAGSFRFAIALMILLLFSWGWQRRTRFIELCMVLSCSLLIVLLTAVTADSLNFEGDLNQSNTFRLYAWLIALEKISTAPVLGVGFPNEAFIKEVGVSFETLDENLIAESWYLSASLAFGLPYAALYLAALLSAFFGRNFNVRDKLRAVLFPYILIDLAYGSFFGGLLIYSWLWILVFADTARSVRLVVRQPAPVKAPLTFMMWGNAPDHGRLPH